MEMNNQQDLDKYLDTLIDKAETESDRIYAKALKDTRKELSLIYEKYETDGVLTLNDMTKYNRLDKLMDQYIVILSDTYNDVYRLSQSTMEQQLTENYFRTAFLMEFEAQKKLGFGQLNPKVIEESFRNPISGLTLKETLEKNRDQVIYKVKQEITQGLVKGESYAKMAKRLTKTFEGDAYKSRRVVRTEAHRAQQLGRLHSIEQAEKYVETERVWDASLDGTTRESHRQLDGQVANEDGLFEINGLTAEAPGMFGDPAEDINCRCTVRVQVSGRQPSVRRARNDDGSTSVIPWTNYEDWYENRIGG